MYVLYEIIWKFYRSLEALQKITKWLPKLNNIMLAHWHYVRFLEEGITVCAYGDIVTKSLDILSHIT